MKDSKPLSINELKEAFFLAKINESSGVDDVSFNIIKKCTFNVQSLLQVFKREQLSLWKTTRFSKWIFHQQCYHPISW